MNPKKLKGKENLELIKRIYDKIKTMKHKVELKYVKRASCHGNIQADSLATGCY